MSTQHYGLAKLLASLSCWQLVFRHMRCSISKHKGLKNTLLQQFFNVLYYEFGITLQLHKLTIKVPFSYAMLYTSSNHR